MHLIRAVLLAFVLLQCQPAQAGPIKNYFDEIAGQEGAIDVARMPLLNLSEIPDACFPMGKEPVDPRKIVEDINRQWVEKCANQSWAPQTAIVQRKQNWLCVTNPTENQHGSTASTVAYRLDRADGKIKLSTKLLLTFSEQDEDRRELFESAVESSKNCVPEIQKFFARSGIELDLKIENAQDRKVNPFALSHQLAVNQLQLRLSVGRSDSSNLFFFGREANGAWAACFKKYPTSWMTECDQDRQKEFCLMMTHELGHLLGLPDEYEDKESCPDREFAVASPEQEPYSVMKDEYHGWDKISFFPRHIGSMLSPMCDENVALDTIRANKLFNLLLPTKFDKAEEKLCKQGSFQDLLTPGAISLLPHTVFHDPRVLKMLTCKGLKKNAETALQAKLSHFFMAPALLGTQGLSEAARYLSATGVLADPAFEKFFRSIFFEKTNLNIYPKQQLDLFAEALAVASEDEAVLNLMLPQVTKSENKDVREKLYRWLARGNWNKISDAKQILAQAQFSDMTVCNMRMSGWASSVDCNFGLQSAVVLALLSNADSVITEEKAYESAVFMPWGADEEYWTLMAKRFPDSKILKTKLQEMITVEHDKAEVELSKKGLFRIYRVLFDTGLNIHPKRFPATRTRVIAMSTLLKLEDQNEVFNTWLSHEDPFIKTAALINVAKVEKLSEATLKNAMAQAHYMERNSRIFIVDGLLKSKAFQAHQNPSKEFLSDMLYYAKDMAWQCKYFKAYFSRFKNAPELECK